MKFFEVLKNYKNIEKQIWSKNMELKALELNNGYPRRNDFTLPSGTMTSDSSLISYMASKQKLKDEIERLETFKENIRNDLDRFLNQFDFFVKMIFELKYILKPKATWKEITDDLNFYSESHIRRLYVEQKKQLEEMEI